MTDIFDEMNYLEEDNYDLQPMEIDNSENYSGFEELYVDNLKLFFKNDDAWYDRFWSRAKKQWCIKKFSRGSCLDIIWENENKAINLENKNINLEIYENEENKTINLEKCEENKLKTDWFKNINWKKYENNEWLNNINWEKDENEQEIEIEEEKIEEEEEQQKEEEIEEEEETEIEEEQEQENKGKEYKWEKINWQVPIRKAIKN